MFIRVTVAIISMFLSAQAFAQSADDTRIVQSFLRVVHSTKLAIDGAAGTGTKNAAASFLKKSGLKYSGNPIVAVRGFLDGDQSGIHGVYSGSYKCNRTVTPATMAIFERRGHQLAVFEFGRYGDKSSPYGVYTHYVRQDRANEKGTRLEFTPRKWLKRPNKYVMVRLKGILDPGQQKVSGKLLHRSCSDFNFARVTSEFAVPQVVAQSDDGAKAKPATEKITEVAASTSNDASSTPKVAETKLPNPIVAKPFEGLHRVEYKHVRGKPRLSKEYIERELGGVENYKKLKKLALSIDDPEAGYRLGNAFYKLLIPQDSRFAVAARWYVLSAQAGNLEALLRLAGMLVSKEGVTHDPKLALEMYRHIEKFAVKNSNIAFLAEYRAKTLEREIENRKTREKIKWDSRLAYYDTITSAKPYFFEEDREDIVPLLPDEAIILVIEDVDIEVEKVPGKRATYQSEKFENIVFVRQTHEGEDVHLVQFSDKKTAITYYVLFRLRKVGKSSGNPEERQRFFIGNPRFIPYLFERHGRRRARNTYIDSPSALEDKLGKKIPNAFNYAEIGNQTIRDYDWDKLPADSLHRLMEFGHGVEAILQADGTGIYSQLVVLDKNNPKDMANFKTMQVERARQLAKLKARPKKSCLHSSVRGRFSSSMNRVAAITNAIVGDRGTIFPRLKCDGNWCYATTKLGGARISLIPVESPDCDPISATTSTCTFFTEIGAGVGGGGVSFNNPIANAIMEKAMKGQRYGRGKAVFDIEECKIIGPLEYTNPQGETFLFD